MQHLGPEHFTSEGVPVIIGIATTGRPAVLFETLQHLSRLADHPDKVLVCLAETEDFSTEILSDMPYPLDVIRSPVGTCSQRNALLQEVPQDAVLLFMDDDFMPADGYISACRRLFTEHPDVVLATGHVLADGIGGPGMDHAAGARVLAASTRTPSGKGPVPCYNAYGCNMAVRVSAAVGNDIYFDTDLPRYGWLEDVDFSRRLARFGRSVKHDAMMGVHLGTKSGRTRGIPLGYSQIANPVYMIRKGTMSRPRALRMMARNLIANAVKSLRPEPWVDRRGRARGNMMALVDLVTGRIAPNRMQDL